MADVEANIVLRTTGGSESAAEINQAAAALNNVTSASSGMEGTFQHRFQHIGLMLFAGDALRASGLGRETRIVVSALNSALIAGEAAGGLASSGILLVVTALTVLAGVIVTVIKHHKDQTEALHKLEEQQNKQYENYEEEIKLLDNLAEKGGGLTDKMQALKDADEKVAADLKANLLVTLDKEISSLEAQRAGLQRSADMHALFAHGLDMVKSALETLLTPFMKVIDATKSLGTSLASMIPSFTTHVKLTGDLATKYDVLSAAIEKAKVQESTLVENNTIDLKKLNDATDAAARERMAADERVAKFAKAQLAEVHKAYEEAEKQREDQLKHQQELTEKVAKKFASDFQGAIKATLFDGKDFAKQFEEMMIKMLENIIAEVIALITVWSILDVVSGGATGSPVSPGSLSSFMGKNFKPFATGGSMVADRPTLALFGEAGPELATFSPIGAGGPATAGDGMGGQTITIGSIVTNVSGVNDPNAIARQVGQKIVEEIRGRGQIDFVRG